jgi:endonuclease/exonuclease/phosphatase family protein
MKVAFWNVNMGHTSAIRRQDTFQHWCAESRPDLLCLEEVGHTLTEKDLAPMTGLLPVGYVNTLDKNDMDSTKRIWALCGKGIQCTAKVLRFPGLEARRALLKVNVNNNVDKMSVWVIHANASKSGGKAATKAAAEHLASEAGAESVVGGDFNFDISLHGFPGCCVPWGWRNDKLPFTQWKRLGGGHSTKVSGNALSPLELVTPRTIYAGFQPHGVIDYVMFGRNRRAKPLPNCETEETWYRILMEFDHAPVLFEIV